MNYIDFKVLYIKFLKASSYMAEKCLEVKDPDDLKWQKLKEIYFRKIVEPLDKAWRELVPKIRHYFINPRK